MATYDSYMLRVWRRTGDRDRLWVARLEHLAGGEVWISRSPQDLFAQMAALLECDREVASSAAGDDDSSGIMQGEPRE
jgi:hypothetical protein